MGPLQYQIEFEGASDREIAEASSWLRDRLEREAEADVTVIGSETGQDLGAVIQILLSSSALMILAKGLADLIRLKRMVKVSVKTSRRTITIDNLAAPDVQAILESLTNGSTSITDEKKGN